MTTDDRGDIPTGVAADKDALQRAVDEQTDTAAEAVSPAALAAAKKAPAAKKTSSSRRRRAAAPVEEEDDEDEVDLDEI